MIVLVCFILNGAAKYEQKHYLSEETPGSPEYDHDAFLGKAEADEFDHLSEEEGKMKLEEIIEKIDANNDEKISKPELKDWIFTIQDKTLKEDAEYAIQQYDQDGNTLLSWKELEDGILNMRNETQNSTTDQLEDTDKMLKREKLKFSFADQDKDGSCSSEEFMAFNNPELFSRMNEYLQNITIETMDSNKDGFVDEKEYLTQLNDPNREVTDEQHLATFRNTFDKDGDGKLTKDELITWLRLDRNLQIIWEVDHLMSLIDDDRNNLLSKEEILKHHDTLVGSHAIQYGELSTFRDEL